MELNHKEDAARKKIKLLFGTTEGEFGPDLFISHHLEEVKSDYWKSTYGTETPEAERILESLVLVSSWSSADDENIDVFDFSLPNNITNYILSARFADGEVAEVSMES